MDDERVTALQLQVTRLDDSVKINNAMTNEMYETYKAMQGGFKVLETLGKVAKPILFIGALFSAIYYFYKTGNWPKET